MNDADRLRQLGMKLAELLANPSADQRCALSMPAIRSPVSGRSWITCRPAKANVIS